MRFLNSLVASAPLRGLAAAIFVMAAPGLVAAQTCPDYNGAAGQNLTFDLAALEAGVEVELLAGGDLRLEDCGEIDGYGHFVQAPDFELTLPDLPAGYGLVVAVGAACDTMLLVNGPDGSYSFNDDFGDVNPMIGRVDGAGVYDIWVGTYEADICDATLQLAIGEGVEELAAGDFGMVESAGINGCPDPNLDGASLVLNASDLSARHVEEMLAGGDVDIGQCMDLPGFGNVITAPDYDLDIEGLPANGQFTLTVASECDTILLVNDPTGEWHYNDDANNSHNPELKLTAGNGRYDVWVGTYDTEVCDASVTFADAGLRRTK